MSDLGILQKRVTGSDLVSRLLINIIDKHGGEVDAWKAQRQVNDELCRLGACKQGDVVGLDRHIVQLARLGVLCSASDPDSQIKLNGAPTNPQERHSSRHFATLG